MRSQAQTPEIDVQNVVVSATLVQELDLEAVAPDLEDASYDPDQFPAIRYQYGEVSATVFIYRSGKIVGTGASSVEVAEDTVANAIEALHTLGIPITVQEEPSVVNIVSTADLTQRINLNTVAIGLGLEHVEYEPEQFSGLIYRLPSEDNVVLIFGSGRVVITASRTCREAKRAVGSVRERLLGLGVLGK